MSSANVTASSTNSLNGAVYVDAATPPPPPFSTDPFQLRHRAMATFVRTRGAHDQRCKVVVLHLAAERVRQGVGGSAWEARRRCVRIARLAAADGRKQEV